MKQKHNEGFSLVEVLLAIVILAAIVVPTCTSMVLSFQMNSKSEELMQAQLAVSSAVEALMAEGIDAERAEDALRNNEGAYDLVAANSADGNDDAQTAESFEENGASVEIPKIDVFPDVSVKIDGDPDAGAYQVTVTDNAGLVSVTTYIRAVTGGSGT